MRVSCMLRLLPVPRGGSFSGHMIDLLKSSCVREGLGIDDEQADMLKTLAYLSFTPAHFLLHLRELGLSTSR